MNDNFNYAVKPSRNPLVDAFRKAVETAGKDDSSLAANIRRKVELDEAFSSRKSGVKNRP